MTTADLLALADRVEKLTGPDRDVDAAIAAHNQITAIQAGGYSGDNIHVRSDEPGLVFDSVGKWAAPSFTASLDAAVTLVPEGYDWIVASVNGQIGGTPYACVGDEKAHFAETPVLSLVLACLRARASTDKGEA